MKDLSPGMTLGVTVAAAVLAAGICGYIFRRGEALQTALGGHHDLATLTGQLRDLHLGLAARGRRTLAAGTLDILCHLAEDQAIAFEQFRALALAAHKPAFIAGLRQDLGLEQEPAESQPS